VASILRREWRPLRQELFLGKQKCRVNHGKSRTLLDAQWSFVYFSTVIVVLCTLNPLNVGGSDIIVALVTFINNLIFMTIHSKLQMLTVYSEL